MSTKSLVFLAILAAVLLGWSIAIAAAPDQIEISFVKGRELILPFDLKRIDTIEIQKEDKKVTLNRQGESFVVSSKYSYPADNSKVNGVITACMKIRCEEEITSRKEAHAELGVDGGKDSQTIRFMEGDKEIVGVIIGKNVKDRRGNYVRLSSEDKVFLSTESSYIQAEDLEYVNKQLMELERKDIAEVEVRGTEKNYTIESPKEGEVKLLGIPEGQRAKGSDYDSVFGLMSYLSFEDFKSESESDSGDLEFDTTYAVTTRSQAVYEFKVAKKEDKYYLKGVGRYAGPWPVTITKDEKDEELKKKEALLQANEAVQEFNKRHKSWVYEVSSWNGENMCKKFADLIEEDKTILSVQEKEISKVEVTAAGKSYSIESPKEGEVNLMGVPEGKRPKGFSHHMVFTACTNLSWESHRLESEAKDLKFETTYKVTTRAGAQYQMLLAKKEDKHYLKCKASFVGADKPLEGEAEEKRLLAQAAVKKHNRRHEGRVYEVQAYAVDNMQKTFEDLIEEDKTILSVKEKEISKVEVTAAGKSYSIESPKEGEVNLIGVPEGKRPKGFMHQMVFTAGTNLSWESHRLESEVKNLKFETTYRVTTRNGAQYELLLAKKGDKRYIKCKASFVGADKPLQGEAEEKRLLAQAAVKKQNHRHEGRVYEVQAWAVDNMQKTFEDLIEDAPPDSLPKEVGASHILISFVGADRSEQTRSKEDARKKAEEILVEARDNPEAFAELAKKNSDGPSGPQGGDLGTFAFEGMVKPFSEAAFKLEVGEVSGIVETGFGFHIIKRTK